MNTTHLLRRTALVIVLAAAIPAPASAQIGAIKKKMREKISQALGADSGSKAAPATGSARAPAAAAPGSARAPAATLICDDNLLEITPALLDRLEKGLAAEQADRKTAPKLLFGADYDRCKKELEESPAYRKEYQEFIARYADLPESRQPEALKENMKREDAQLRAQCGPPFQEADKLRFSLPRRAEEAGQTAAALTPRQYAILKERIMPLCEATETAAGPGGELQVPKKASSSHVFFAYKATEVEAIRPRCAKLATAFRN